jgi:hypothetical protein
MPITANDLHFRHFQSAPGGTIQVFACLVGTTPDGKEVDGPLHDANVTLTPEELVIAQAVIDRGKQTLVDRLNPPPEV